MPITPSCLMQTLTERADVLGVEVVGAHDALPHAVGLVHQRLQAPGIHGRPQEAGVHQGGLAGCPCRAVIGAGVQQAHQGPRIEHGACTGQATCSCLASIRPNLQQCLMRVGANAVAQIVRSRIESARAATMLEADMWPHPQAVARELWETLTPSWDRHQ